MNATSIESQFAAIGARFKLRLSADRWETNDYAIDIRRDRQGDFFELRLEERLRDSLDASVLQADKRDATESTCLRARNRPSLGSCHHHPAGLASRRAKHGD